MKHLVTLLLPAALALLPACHSSSSSGDDGVDTGTNTDTGTGEECSEEEKAAQQDALEQAVHGVDPCFSGNVDIGSDSTEAEVTFSIGECGPGGFEYCHDSYQYAEQIDQVSAATDLSCWANSAFYIHGSGTLDQLQILVELVNEHDCDPPNDNSLYVVVVVGEDGSITDVNPVGEVEPADLECVAEALVDQVFPCLAGLELCSCWSSWD